MIEIPTTLLRVLAAAAFLLPVAGLLAYSRRRRGVAEAIGDPGLVRDLIGEDLSRAPWIRLLVVGLSAAALAFALLDPALAAPRYRPRGPVVLLLDASGSMLAEDVGAPRLEVQRQVARSIVEQLPELPVGIVAFAGRAFSLTPPTRDRGAVEMYLSSIHPSIVTQSGSALGAAIRQGLGLLGLSDDRAGGTVVLIGDGDETDDPEAALEAATLARRAGVVVHTIGIGGDLGAPVPAFDLATGATTGYLRGDDGEVVLTRRSEDLLREISDRGGGVYAGAELPDAVSRVVEAVRGSPATAEAATNDGVPTYAWLAAAAFFLLLLEPAAAKRGREA